MKSKRYRLITVLLSMSMAFGLLAGCGSQPQNAASTGSAAESTKSSSAPQGSQTLAASTKDSIVIALDIDAGTMNPYEGSFGPQLSLTTQSIETLFLYNKDGVLVPWLVADYKFDDDLMGITVKLRDDVYFHNGDKMTSADVLYSFEIVGTSPGASAIMSAIDRENVKAVDEYTVYIPTNIPCGTLTHVLSNLFVVNRNTYESDAARGQGLIGTGPWIVTDWQAGVSVSFRAFSDYWGGEPPAKELTIRIITESSVRMIELENKTIDIYRNAPTTDIARVNNGEVSDIAVWQAKNSQAIHYLGFNSSHAPFNDVRVRQAVCYALDTEAIATAVFEGRGNPSTSLLPGNAWFSPNLPEELRYRTNVDKAIELLKEAGYGDGLSVTLYVDGIAHRHAMAELIPSMLSKAGITVELVFMETAAYNAYMLAENGYDMFLGNFGNLYEPSGSLSPILTSNNKGGANGRFHHADDPEATKVDELLNKAKATADDSERAKVYQELAELWAARAYSISIVDQLDTNLVASNLDGMFFSPNINVQFATYK